MRNLKDWWREIATVIDSTLSRVHAELSDMFCRILALLLTIVNFALRGPQQAGGGGFEVSRLAKAASPSSGEKHLFSHRNPIYGQFCSTEVDRQLDCQRDPRMRASTFSIVNITGGSRKPERRTYPKPGSPSIRAPSARNKAMSQYNVRFATISVCASSSPETGRRWRLNFSIRFRSCSALNMVTSGHGLRPIQFEKWVIGIFKFADITIGIKKRADCAP